MGQTLFYVRHGRRFERDDESVADVGYLKQYGYSQSMGDICAGVADKIWNELAEKAMPDLKMVLDKKAKKPFDQFAAYLKDPANKEYADVWTKAWKDTTRVTEWALLEKRDLAIAEGRVSSRAGSEEEAVAVEMRRIAMPHLAAWCKAQGFAGVPKDKDVRREALLLYVTENEATLRPVAEANLANQAALAAKLAK